MIIYLDEAFHAYQRAGRMRTQHDLFEAITYGAVQRVRPKLMTVAMITLGLLPALWAHGAGAEAIQRIAAPMIGGLITSTILTLEIVPAIYSLWRGRHVEWVSGKPPRKSWAELNREFVQMEREGHHGSDFAVEPTPLPQDAHATAQLTPVGSGNQRKFWQKYGWVLLVLALAAVAAAWWLRRSSVRSTLAESAANRPVAIDASLPAVSLTPGQATAISNLFRFADAVSHALSSDDITTFNALAPTGEAAGRGLHEVFPASHPWASLIAAAAPAAAIGTAQDLADARAKFLACSSTVVGLATAVRQQASNAVPVRIYRCPMAPKPGVWIQSDNPLRNPFFGKEMLDCGNEIK